MPVNTPDKNAQGQEGLGLANAFGGSLLCGLVLIDGPRKIALITDEAAQITGLNAAQAVGASFEILPEPLPRLVRESLAAAKPMPDRRVEIRAGEGETRSVRVSARPARPTGEGPGVALVLTDLTSALRLEERIEQLDRLANIGTLAATMAHEIKNALVAGKTFIDLLLEKHQDAELVETVRREMGRIDSIVSRILKFAGPTRLPFSAVHLHEVLDHSLRMVQHPLEGKAISLNRSFQAAPDLVKGDDCGLQQAFVNLFLNALDAMGPDGTLTVSTEIVAAVAAPVAAQGAARLKQFRVRIQDTGPGIGPEDKRRLFEPFFTTKPTGTGLGLAITRRIIQEHRGGITVESQPGQGTTFNIVLPIAPGP